MQIHFFALINTAASVFSRARTLGDNFLMTLPMFWRGNANARLIRYGGPVAGGIFLLISMLGCAEVPKAHPKVETVEQLLVELDFGFTHGLFDDEKFFEERIGYRLGGFPKD